MHILSLVVDKMAELVLECLLDLNILKDKSYAKKKSYASFCSGVRRRTEKLNDFFSPGEIREKSVRSTANS